MNSITLKHPITVDGVSIASVTLRRPKAKDMIAIGDHLPALAALDAKDETKAIDGMSRKVFEAMVAVVGTLGQIGVDTAMELDFEDLVLITTEAFDFLGEGQGDGAATNGARP